MALILRCQLCELRKKEDGSPKDEQFPDLNQTERVVFMGTKVGY